jgi:ubiquinone/menaquinone biosynthesis C-methylase UbiE
MERRLGHGMRVLDLGCGIGDVSLLARRLVGRAEASVASIALRRCSPRRPRVQPGKGSAQPDPAATLRRATHSRNLAR